MPTPYLGLWTSTVDDTSTAATAGELDLHDLCPPGDLVDEHERRGVGLGDERRGDHLPGRHGGRGTVTFWMLGSSSSGAGDNIAWGTATSTVISTTQTPPTVDIGGLVITLD